MLNNNIKIMRKMNKFSQEKLAELLDVSRQSVAKWEKGESVPDLNKLIAMKDIFNVTLDELVKESSENDNLGPAPKGKHILGTLVIDENHKVELPQKAFEVFGYKVGDEFLLLGDEDDGMAIVEKSQFMQRMNDLMNSVD